MEPARDLVDLRVYQGAFAAASEIFRDTKQFPVEERYSLTQSIRKLMQSRIVAISRSAHHSGA